MVLQYGIEVEKLKKENIMNLKAEQTVDTKNATIGMTDDEKIDFVAAQILEKYRPAFEELAK